jgi:3-oxoacyl-(acyl-carrier-protein) synthase
MNEKSAFVAGSPAQLNPSEPLPATVAIVPLGLTFLTTAPQDEHYANLHGTSKEMNDRIEIRAMKLARSKHAETIPKSDLKSQIGHAQGASGSAGVAATLTAMEHGKIFTRQSRRIRS